MAYYKDVDVIEAIYDALRTPPLKGVSTDTMSLAVAMAEKITDADVRENTHGKWLRRSYIGYGREPDWCHTYYMCSACRGWVSEKGYDFCPNCGADMRKK